MKESILQKEFYSKLNNDKIAMNWKKNPIKMDLFLSFLTIEPTRSYKHSGSDMGWTELTSEKLIIRGGIICGSEYLYSLQYGTKLQNQYNNYVNPFYLFDIMNVEGQAFFLEYYKNEIEGLENKLQGEIEYLENQINSKKEIKKAISEEMNIRYNLINAS